MAVALCMHPSDAPARMKPFAQAAPGPEPLFPSRPSHDSLTTSQLRKLDGPRRDSGDPVVARSFFFFFLNKYFHSSLRIILLFC